MKKLAELKLAQKIQASGRKGVIVGLAIAAVVCIGVAFVVIKMNWIKKQFGCLHCEVDSLGDDFIDEDDAYEKDFV